MPIRTNRGRAAVYRRLWGAPMRSPKHLAAALAVVTVLLVLGGILLPKLLGDSGGNGAVSSAAERMSESDTPAGYSNGIDASRRSRLPQSRTPMSAPKSVEPDEQALRVVSKWAEAWVDHSSESTKKEWLAELEPYTTDEFLPQMKSIRLSNVPSSEVTGEPEPVSSHAKSVVAKVPTDGPELRVTVVDTDEGWRVTRYEQAG